MVSDRCKMIVRSELEELGLHFIIEQLGEVEINEGITKELYDIINRNLKKSGLELLDDKKSVLIEKIKHIIMDLVYFSDMPLKLNMSDYISERVHYDYTYVANLFSEHQGITIEHFYLSHKIERVKELLIYDELRLTEIADKLHYSSIAHLSNQFKKMTGLTPSNYKRLRIRARNTTGNV